MNKFLCLALTLITSLHVNFSLGQGLNQEDSGLSSKIIYAPSQHCNVLKPGLKFGYEIPQTEDISLIAWGGFYHNNLYLFKNTLNDSFFNYRNLIGFHLAVESKKYFKSKYRTLSPKIFISLTLGLDKIIENRRERVLRQSGAYTQSIDFQRKELSFPLIAHFGRKLFNLHSVQVDGSLGMGCRYFIVSNDLHEEVEFQEFDFFRNSGDVINGNFFRFAFQIGLFISIPISKQSNESLKPNVSTGSPSHSL